MQQVHCVILDKETYCIVTREAIFSDKHAYFLYLLTFFIFARMLDQEAASCEINCGPIYRSSACFAKTKWLFLHQNRCVCVDLLFGM